LLHLIHFAGEARAGFGLAAVRARLVAAIIEPRAVIKFGFEARYLCPILAAFGFRDQRFDLVGHGLAPLVRWGDVATTARRWQVKKLAFVLPLWHGAFMEPHPLTRYRARRRLSQAALAQALGVTKSTVSRWENGKRYPERPELLKIVAVTGISPLKLLQFVPQTEAAE
jgi:DNA-binding XRE family transcriptional regulator